MGLKGTWVAGAIVICLAVLLGLLSIVTYIVKTENAGLAPSTLADWASAYVAAVAALAGIGGTIAALYYIVGNNEVLREMRHQTDQLRIQNDFLAAPRLRCELSELQPGAACISPAEESGFSAGIPLRALRERWMAHLEGTRIVTSGRQKKEICVTFWNDGVADVEEIQFEAQIVVRHLPQSNNNHSDSAIGQFKITESITNGVVRKHVLIAQVDGYPEGSIVIKSVAYKDSRDQRRIHQTQITRVFPFRDIAMVPQLPSPDPPRAGDGWESIEGPNGPV